MLSSDLIRLGGLAALVGAALFVISDLLGLLVFAEGDFSEIAVTGSYALLVALSLLAFVLM